MLGAGSTPAGRTVRTLIVFLVWTGVVTLLSLGVWDVTGSMVLALGLSVVGGVVGGRALGLGRRND